MGIRRDQESRSSPAVPGQPCPPGCTQEARDGMWRLIYQRNGEFSFRYLIGQQDFKIKRLLLQLNKNNCSWRHELEKGKDGYLCPMLHKGKDNEDGVKSFRSQLQKSDEKSSPIKTEWELGKFDSISYVHHFSSANSVPHFDGTVPSHWMVHPVSMQK